MLFPGVWTNPVLPQAANCTITRQSAPSDRARAAPNRAHTVPGAVGLICLLMSIALSHRALYTCSRSARPLGKYSHGSQPSARTLPDTGRPVQLLWDPSSQAPSHSPPCQAPQGPTLPGPHMPTPSWRALPAHHFESAALLVRPSRGTTCLQLQMPNGRRVTVAATARAGARGRCAKQACGVLARNTFVVAAAPAFRRQRVPLLVRFRATLPIGAAASICFVMGATHRPFT